MYKIYIKYKYTILIYKWFVTVLVYIMVACLMFATSLPSFTGQLDRHTYDILPKYTKVKDFVKEHTSSSIPGFFYP